MNILVKVMRKLHIVIVRKLSMGKKISRLRREADVTIKALANVFNAVIKNKCSYEEKDRIEKIETLRNRLNSSSIKISLIDYGAGSPDSNLTAKEMYKGRPAIRSVREICRLGSKPYREAFLLFKLVREFRPSVCLELGTALGISSAYQTAALELNRCGRITTLEGAESLASLAKENFERLGFKRIDVVVGRFQDTLQDVLRKNADIDYVFIDGHHDENATLSYFRKISPYLSDGAILVFDDIHWSGGMERAWDDIRKNKNLKVSVDFLNMGICVFTKLAVEKVKYFKITI